MSTESPSLSPASLAKYIDHTLLRPEATEAEIVRACDEAKEFDFKGICIERRWLPLVVERLKGTSVIPVTVIAFPKGNEPTAVKVAQAKEAVALGAGEVDMVLNRESLHKKDYRSVQLDIASVVDAIKPTPVKVILETSELTRDEKLIACALAKAAGARFVKTSTGFSKGGASEEDIRLMREVVGEELGVKASGGVRTTADAEKMIRAGADRLGTSASVAIVKGTTGSSGGY